MGHRDPLEVLDQVRAWSRTTTDARATHRTLTSDELRLLAGDGLIAIGAHSMEHPTLGLIPVNRQLQEIGGSKRALEDIVGQSVTSFSYPFGRCRPLRRDYTRATIDAVRRCGFTLACTTNSSVVTRRSGPYEIPRLVVRDWSGDELVEQIRRRLPSLRRDRLGNHG
jgi:peptidoglycan/xylan/chitin deacetylase (PgdA/CDA1 family)